MADKDITHHGASSKLTASADLADVGLAHVETATAAPKQEPNIAPKRKKRMALVTFKFADTHPRVNRLANTFKECDYDVTVYGLSRDPKHFTNSNGIKFVTFPMRNTVRTRFTSFVMFPISFIMGSVAAITLIYCRIRNI